MPRGNKIDVDLVHQMLWNRVDRLGRVMVVQKTLAEEMGCSKFTICRVFARLEEDGKLKKLEGHRGNTWTYAIKDPSLWDE